MNTRKAMTLTLAAAAVAVIGGQMATAGIDAGGEPGSSSGGITKFSSVYVNGTRFETDNALFIVDGRLGSESDLDVGQVVNVYGVINADGENGTAYIVRYDDAVEGPVSAVDTATGQITVLGQTVVVNGDTHFTLASGATTIDAIPMGEAVEVSGFPDADGRIIATFIGDADDLDLTGTITSVDQAAMTFAVNDLVVDYSSAGLLEVDGGAPAAGATVTVAGSGVDSDGRLVATKVVNALNGIDAGGGPGSVEGYVTRRESLVDFEVNGTPIRVRYDTKFVNDWFFGLALNRKVEVNGRFDDNGVLVASRVDFERGAEMAHSGRVNAIIGDVVFVDGAAVRITGETMFDDDSDADVRRFGIDDLGSGDRVEIRGFEGAGGQIIATRIERQDDDNED